MPIDSINNLPFMPQFFVYIKYSGNVSDDFQMEQWYYHDEEGHGWGSTGSFKPEVLIIGNNLEQDFYIGIRTVIKIIAEEIKKPKKIGQTFQPMQNQLLLSRL